MFAISENVIIYMTFKFGVIIYYGGKKEYFCSSCMFGRLYHLTVSPGYGTPKKMHVNTIKVVSPDAGVDNTFYMLHIVI